MIYVQAISGKQKFVTIKRAVADKTKKLKSTLGQCNHNSCFSFDKAAVGKQPYGQNLDRIVFTTKQHRGSPSLLRCLPELIVSCKMNNPVR